jgi:hypothetical protein
MMMMMCIMYSTNRHDSAINDNIRKSVMVTTIIKKMVESQLSWSELLERRFINSLVNKNEWHFFLFVKSQHYMEYIQWANDSPL